MRICVIFNPAARGEKAKRFRDHLASLSKTCTLKPTYAPGTGHQLAAEAVREGFDLVVAAGGDGTVNEVLNGIGETSDGLAHVRLGVLPLGTVNVFAKELRMPAAFERAWTVIETGRESVIDLGEAEFKVDGQTQRRFFVQMAGAGLDSRAVELVDWEHKKMIGPFAYIVAGLKAMRGPQPQLVATDGRTTIAGELVLIGNGRYYGGRFAFFPTADQRDGLLEVSMLPRANWPSLCRAGWGLLTDRLYRAGGVQHLRSESIRVFSPVPMPFHVEGENIGYLPVKFSARRQALRVIVP
jgi:diacylglycerol kinase (ATP)